MTHEHTRRAHTLDVALAAFDRAHARRQHMRHVAGTGGLVAATAVAVLIAWPAHTTGSSEPRTSSAAITPAAAAVPHTNAHMRLPAFVEILTTDDELLDALEEAGICDGLGRDGDHVFIVPCASPASEVPMASSAPGA